MPEKQHSRIRDVLTPEACLTLVSLCLTSGSQPTTKSVLNLYYHWIQQNGQPVLL